MDWLSGQCLLCLETRDKYKSLNDSIVNQFYKITSAVLTIPVSDERGICQKCYISVKSTVDFVNKIIETKEFWGISNTPKSNLRKIETGSNSSTTHNIISKLQMNGKICIKKITNTHARSEPIVPILPIKEEEPLDILETDPFQEEFTDEMNYPDNNDCEDEDDNDNDLDYKPEHDESNSSKKIRKYAKKVHEIVLDAPIAYTCRKCHISWPTIGELHEHMKTSPCFTSDLKCKFCDRAFQTWRKFASHLATHRPKETFMCEECSTIFKNQFTLEMHLQSVHGRIRLTGAIFTCHHCYVKFHSHAELSAHMQEHIRDKKESEKLCEDCGKKCANLKAYRAHIRTHSEKPKRFKCKECDKCFRQKIYLMQHSHVHTGIKAFKCEYCPKSFAKKESLVYHRREHENNYPYSCDNCNKSFVSLMRLRTHLNRCVPT